MTWEAVLLRKNRINKDREYSEITPTGLKTNIGVEAVFKGKKG